MKNPEILVFGGGLAGLTTAYRLAERGCKVRLFEASDDVGGQLYTLRGKRLRKADPLGEARGPVMHGTHGWYRDYYNTCGLMRELGTFDQLCSTNAWFIVGPSGEIARIAGSSLPHPLSSLPSVLAIPWLNTKDRLSFLAGTTKLLLRSRVKVEEADSLSTSELLHSAGFTPRAAGFWKSVMLAFSKNRFGDLSGKYGVLGIRLALGMKNGIRTYWNSIGNSEILPDPLAEKIRRSGGRIYLEHKVIEVREVDDKVRAAVSACGKTEQVFGDYAVLAMQPRRAAAVLPWLRPRWADIAPVRPVATAFLGFDRRVDHRFGPAAVLLDPDHGHLAHVITDSSIIVKHYRKGPTVLRFEVSDYRPVRGAAQRGAFIRRLARDAASIIPELAQTKVAWSYIVPESDGFISVNTGTMAKLPKTNLIGARILLAGDWTCAPKHVGMEPAVTSGCKAAEAVIRREGLPRIEYHHHDEIPSIASTLWPKAWSDGIPAP